MSTFVTLTNKVLTRLNEVPLDTQGDGFDSVRGVQALVKTSVNNAIRTILQEAQEWPFLKTLTTQELTSGTQVYNYPSDYSSVDIGSFYLKKDDTLGNEPMKLKVITYEEYLDKYREIDDNGKTGSPEVIYQTYEGSFGVSPVPDAAYTIEYVYWVYPNDLELYNDSCIIPTRFDHVIVDGAMVYLMMFRSNEQSAQIHKAAFDNGIKMMRRVLMDDMDTLRSTVIYGRG